MRIFTMRINYTLRNISRINKENFRFTICSFVSNYVLNSIIMKPLLLVLVFMVFFCTLCYSQKKIKHTPTTSVKPPIIKYGIASYYAKKFDKRRTANGEIYRSEKYSAACNVLPLGTWIKVTNLRNKRSVVLKTNDRLSAKNKRLVDLSWIAAKELGYISRGLTKVKVEVLDNFHLARE